MPETIQERLGLRAPKEHRTKSTGIDGIDPTLLYGVELEIENLEADEDDRANRAVAGMQYHKDGSLRNNGGEFVTLPMNFSTLAFVLEKFFSKGGYDEDNYSERCSVHVHANCQDLTVEQVRLILCLYQTLEKVLFNYVAGDRDKNIFCVPLGESVMATKLLVSDDVLINSASRKWRKYTALNLLPLYTQGTIEFRHMPGTHDLAKILQWCNIIGCLFKYAREHKYSDVVKTLNELNTTSAYATFMQNIFPDGLYDVLTGGNFREYLEEGIINMKVMLAAPTKNDEEKGVIYDDVAPHPQAVFPNPWEVVNRVQADMLAAAGMPQPRQPEPDDEEDEAPPRVRALSADERNRVAMQNLRRQQQGLRPLSDIGARDWLRRNPVLRRRDGGL